MTQSMYLVVLVFVLVAVVSLVGLIKIFKVFNSPNGERYRKLKMQGPFVPLSEHDLEVDRQRMAERATRAAGEP